MMTDIDRREFDRLLARAEDGEPRNEWEEEFLDSLAEKSRNPFWDPTDRQWEKLEQIAERR